MPFIALITDWQQNDYYLGALRGYIYSQLPDVHLIDINHGIALHNIFQAAFTLRACFLEFPEGTVFIIGVKSDADGGNCYVCMKYLNRYIISSDNGFFSLFTEDKPDSVFSLTEKPTTFPEKDIFAKYACLILKGETLLNLATPVTDYKIVKNFFPIPEKSSITGTIIYIDNYGNAITNISKELFEKNRNKRPFIIYPGNNNYAIKKISDSYNENEDTELVALFNSIGLLEIAIINASASQLIKLDLKTNIRIQFYDTTNS